MLLSSLPAVHVGKGWQLSEVTPAPASSLALPCRSPTTCLPAPACTCPPLPQSWDVSRGRRGSALMRLRAGVLRKTGYLDGHTETLRSLPRMGKGL